ncbi:MAG: heat-inducible transcription repressor HrcA [Ignavibacteriae bacterium]|nr:heat-inducible transcription repressor HrcA [Ignavibacteriota bacterium]MCB9216468.1 heat-inducible transcription repressor HrcA [Ignavibacteria bacterium]
MADHKPIAIQTFSLSDLTDREELVLRNIVHHYVLTANPVGSRFLSKRLDEESLSAATIRNVMADLEEKGYISHPHTSAGRVPTDQGYRLYVDMLIRMEGLTHAEQQEIRRGIHTDAPQAQLMKETSRLIAAISNQLGIVTAPEILGGILERLELVQLSSSRLMVILSLRAGMVKTVMLEVHEEVSRDQMERLTILLNERLGGLTIREIRGTYRDRLLDLASSGEASGLVRIFLDSAERIFDAQPGVERVHVAPAKEILHQPEFSSPEQVRGIVELMENEEIVIHLLEGHQAADNGVHVAIGMELEDERMAEYSMIATRYKVGETHGTIGLIGPKRMNYARLMSLVGYVANTLTNQFDER